MSFSPNSQLRHVDLSATIIYTRMGTKPVLGRRTSVQLAGLGRQANLMSLDISGRIGVTGTIHELQQCRQLQMLRLADTDVADEDARAMQKILSLVEVDLSRSKVTASGVVQLSVLPRLKALSLDGLMINEDALRSVSLSKNVFEKLVFPAGGEFGGFEVA